MNLIKRMVRISNARIESFLSSVEDPELMFPQLVREMEEQVKVAIESEAQVLTAVKTAERAVTETRTKIQRMETGASSAMQNQDVDTAREAIAAQLELESTLARRTESYDRAQAGYQNARVVRLQTQEKLEEIRGRRDELISRARLAKSQKKIERTIHSPLAATDSILDTIERMETQVEQAEAELAVEREIRGNAPATTSLENKLNKLATDSEVESRLNELKKKFPAS